MFADVYDLARPVVAVWNVFDFAGHVERMRVKHPDWSKAQLECCLYWQGTARRQLRAAITGVLWSDQKAETCPEAMGVNVVDTMGSVGVYMEWPPVTKTIQVALLAHPIGAAQPSTETTTGK
ncbi:MAG: hypothetical protein ACYTEX_10925 [Planctomycetota bacterium]